jgi:hypothetical protein
MTPFPRRTAEVYRILDTWKGDVDFINASALDLLADLSKRSGVSILIDPQVDFENKPITFRSKDLVLKNNLKLLLSQFQLDYVAVDGWVVVSKPGRMELSNPVPIWLPAQEAKAAQKLLQDAVSPETTKIARPKLMDAGRPALAWLGAAADAALPADAAMYRALSRICRLAERLDRRPSLRRRPSEPLGRAEGDPRPSGGGRSDGLENLPLVVKSPKKSAWSAPRRRD